MPVGPLAGFFELMHLCAVSRRSGTAPQLGRNASYFTLAVAIDVGNTFGVPFSSTRTARTNPARAGSERFFGVLGFGNG